MNEQSKSLKTLEFGYLTKAFKKEQKASYFYNTLGKTSFYQHHISYVF